MRQKENDNSKVAHKDAFVALLLYGRLLSSPQYDKENGSIINAENLSDLWRWGMLRNFRHSRRLHIYIFASVRIYSNNPLFLVGKQNPFPWYGSTTVLKLVIYMMYRYILHRRKQHIYLPFIWLLLRVWKY